MVGVGTCVVAVAAYFVVVAAVPSVRMRRNYVNGYLLDTVEDASIAGDHIGVADCSDDDSSESIERAYIIINKREAKDQLTRSLVKTRPAAASHVTNLSQVRVPSRAR